MAVVRELVTKLTFDTNMAALRQFDRRIGNMRENVRGLSGNLGEVSAKVRNFGAGLSLFLTAPILLMGKSFITAASDAEESRQKFGVVFKDITAESEKTADNLAKDFGLAGTTARELLGDTGDLLTGFGFTGKSALDLSKQVNELAVDLASFTNFSGGAEGASKALTKALLGERESVKSLGISILEEDVKKQVALNTTKGLTFETNRQAKAFATLQIAQRQSQNAIGDYARTSQGAANQFRLFGERVKDLKEKFGKLLLPIAVKLTKVFIKLVEFLGDLPKPIKLMILSFLGLAAVIGPIILIVGLLGQAIAGIIALGPILGGIGIAGIGAFLILAAKIIVVIAAISAVLFLLIDDFKVWKSGGDSAIGAILGNFENFKNKVVSIFNFIKSFFMAFWAAITTNGDAEWSTFLDLLIKGFVGFVKLFFKIAMEIPKIMTKIVFGILKVVGNLLLKLGSIIGGFAKAVIGKVAGLLGLEGGQANENAQAGGAFSTPSLAGFTAPAVTGTSKNIDVKASVTLQIPQGTSEEQQASLKESTEKLFEQRLNDAMGNAILANGRNEQ